MDKNTLTQIGDMLVYSPVDILINMALAIALGLIVCWVYRYTHRGFRTRSPSSLPSYSYLSSSPR